MILDNIDKFSHGSVLFKKKENNKKLSKAWLCYEWFRETVDNLSILSEKPVISFVDALNEYRENTIYTYEELENSGQQYLRSTILEEAFQHLFKDLAFHILGENKDNLIVGKENSYVSMSFTPRSFTDLITSPNPYIHTKDQDFILGCTSEFLIFTNDAQRNTATNNKVIVPALAIECKTYLERNMLDTCASTAERLKSAMPYCLYIVASEFLKMDDAYPELSKIDEVYVLCKASNSERADRMKIGQPPHEIDAGLIWDLYKMVRKHLNSIWWSPDDALERGKLINRP
jgi:hypothetical protein